MQKHTAIIVDDEQDSRETLRYYVSKYCPNITLVGECENIEEAQKTILSRNPAIVFLDIEMPFGNAFDLLERLEQVDFEIIFITAFSQYAVRAFNLSAVHYLLKPVDIDELVSAVEKAEKRILESSQLNHSKILLDNLSALNTQQKKVVLPLMDGFEVVRLGEITFCEAQDNFTYVHFQNGRKSLICRKLKFYDDALSEHGFCRVHRSFLINMEYVKRYIKGKGGTVVMENGTEIQVANGRKSSFLERFK
jgi:two-component system LytT family response regulator